MGIFVWIEGKLFMVECRNESLFVEAFDQRIEQLSTENKASLVRCFSIA